MDDFPARKRQTLTGLVQHYIRDLVYGATDGMITTFAIVAGVTGGTLTARTVVVLGVANLIADGLSMGVSNYLAIRSEERVRQVTGEPVPPSRPVRRGMATFWAFVVAGAVPLAPYLLPRPAIGRFVVSGALTFMLLFLVGAARARIGAGRWWTSGLEMLGLGLLAGAAAFAAGAMAANLVGGDDTF